MMARKQRRLQKIGRKKTEIQSNLSVTATLGTEESDLLWRGGRCGEVGVFLGVQHVIFCATFMLTVSHNHGNLI